MVRRAATLVGIALMIAIGHRAQVSTQAAPSTGLLLIVSMDEAKVDIVDEATSQTVASLSTGKTPHEVRVGPDGRTAYVVSGPIITAIDLSSRTVKRMVLSADGRRAYVTNPEDHSATIVDLEGGRVLSTLKTGKRPDGIAWIAKP